MFGSKEKDEKIAALEAEILSLNSRLVQETESHARQEAATKSSAKHERAELDTGHLMQVESLTRAHDDAALALHSRIEELERMLKDYFFIIQFGPWVKAGGSNINGIQYRVMESHMDEPQGRFRIPTKHDEAWP